MIEELIARILTDLRECAERQFGGPIRSAMVGCPVRFVGDEGWVEVGDSGGIEVHPASLRSELTGLGDRPSGGLDVGGHARNFFDCIKSRGRPAANSQVMRHSHIACHAAALSWLLKRRLRLDPAREEFIGDSEANGLRALPSRNVL